TPKHYILTQLKNNLDPPQVSLAYAVNSDASGTPCVAWQGPSGWSHEDLTAATRWRRTKRLRASEFLAVFLKDGPRSARDIGPTSRAQGFSKKTLERAADDLGIRCHRVNHGLPTQTTWWLLPGQELPDHLRAKREDDDDELEAWLAPLRARFPAR